MICNLSQEALLDLARRVAEYYDEYAEINNVSFKDGLFEMEILCDDGVHSCRVKVPEDIRCDVKSLADYIGEKALNDFVNESLTPGEEAGVKAGRERRAKSALLRDIKKNGMDLYGNSYDRFGVIPGEEVDRYYHSMYHDDYGKLTDVREIPYNEFKKYVNPEIYTPEQGERLANFVKEYDDKVKQYTDLKKPKLAKEAENDRKYWQDYLDTWTAKRDLARKVEAEPTGQMSLFGESKKIKRYGDQTKLFGKHSGEISESFFANNYDKGELEEIIHVLILNFGPVDVYKGTDEVYVTIYDATEDEVNACLADGFDNYRVKQVAARANDRGIARTFMFYFEDEDYVRDFNMSHDTDCATQNWW